MSLNLLGIPDMVPHSQAVALVMSIMSGMKTSIREKQSWKDSYKLI